MSCCFVLADDTLVDHAVDGRNCRLVGSRSSGTVTGIAGNNDILDLSAHPGAQTHVVFAGLLRLAGALPS